MTGFAKSDLLAFLDFLAEKGLMKQATSRSRKAAVNTLLSILNEEEGADLRGLDLDELMARFTNLKPHEFKPASLQVYRSRLSSSLDDFFRYRKDPAAFKPKTQSRAGAQKGTPEDKKEPRTKEAATQLGQSSVDTYTTAVGPMPIDEVETIVFPIPLRPRVIVRVSGIPSDLTPEEAEKIGNVILALSGSQEA